ncbi:MAG: PriCT-2 domain-containing protein, partial [Pseudomonadales bacterium]|nr:PriCT-2 domain-containing protein [Pseudomonadales bacterium]
EAFLNALDGKDVPFTFQTFDDVKVWSEEKQKFINRQAPNLAHIFQGIFNQHKQALAALNAKGAGVYVTVNQTDLKGRKEENIVKVRALFVDLDGSPLQPILDLEEDLQPHFIIESSPNKWHCYWLVNNCELEQFKPLQQALAAKFDGDKAVCDLPRVMRLAGFSHNKAESFITRIHTMQANLYPYSVNKLIVGLGLNNIRGQERSNNNLQEKQLKNDGHIYTRQDEANINVHQVHHVHLLDDENPDFDLILTNEQINDLKNALSFIECESYASWQDIGQALKTIANLDDVGLNLWLEWSSKSPKFDRAEAVKKWHNDLKGDRTTYKAIFTKAQANGWKNPQAKESIIDAALLTVREALASDDVGVMFDDATIKALTTLYTSSKANYARVRHEIKQNRAIKLSDLEALIKPEREEEQSTTERLLDIAKEQCEFFHDKDKEPYAVFNANGARQCYHLQSKGFREWLANELYKADETAPADNILNATINALIGQAKFDGDEKPVYMRVAKHESAYWLDLCNDKWQAVKITSTGWQVIDNPNVLFTRGDNMRPLPLPNGEGDLSKLWQLVNIPEQDHDAVIAWLIESMRPDTPYTVLELTGEQGSTKSTTQKHLKLLIDPNKSNLRTAPKAIEDIWVNAKHCHVVSYENISHLSSAYQDAFCILSTGGAYATRTLHTTCEETVIELKKPIILNGIPVNVTAQDLLDRTIHIDLPVIESRLTEEEVKELFEQHYPEVFTGLLDMFVLVLATLPTINDIPRNELPRMADFTLLGEAVARVQGKAPKTFLRQYQNKRTEGVYRTLESSPVAVALLAYLEENPFGYEGTVKRLLDILTPLTPQGESWPRSLKGFGDILRRLAPAFRIVGFNVIHLGHKRDGHHWQIKQIPKQSTKNSQKCDQRDHCDRDMVGEVDNDIYMTGKNGEKTTHIEDVEVF